MPNIIYRYGFLGRSIAMIGFPLFYYNRYIMTDRCDKVEMPLIPTNYSEGKHDLHRYFFDGIYDFEFKEYVDFFILGVDTLMVEFEDKLTHYVMAKPMTNEEQRKRLNFALRLTKAAILIGSKDCPFIALL